MKIDTNALILAQILGGGGSSVTVEPLAVTANGEYTAPTGKAYSPVTVNVAKPDYLISDGDTVSTFYFNTAYALGTWLATLTYSDLDPDTGLYVCYTGLGYFFGVDLTSGQYALVWNDGVNIVPIYVTIAVPEFGVTEAGWQRVSYTPSVATSVVVSQIIPELSEVIDDVIAGAAIDFGGVTIRRTKVAGTSHSYKSSSTSSPADQSDFIATASIAVPNDEAILGVSYIAGVQGGMGKYSTGIFISPGVTWNSTASDITVSRTVGVSDTTVSVTCDLRNDSFLATACGLPCDCGTIYVAVFLEVISKK